VKLSALSKGGRDVVVAMLGPGDFFGEGCLAGQATRISTATASAPTTILMIRNSRMLKVLHQEPRLADRFIAHMLSRHAGTERDLIGRLFDSDEKRLAQALLLLARYGKQNKPRQIVSKISRETLSDMIGVSRSRVNVFMNKFKRSGFIEFSGSLAGEIRINTSLLNVVLHD
jgi:CRP-like cAMP-binding protein